MKSLGLLYKGERFLNKNQSFSFLSDLFSHQVEQPSDEQPVVSKEEQANAHNQEESAETDDEDEVVSSVPSFNSIAPQDEQNHTHS